WVRVASGQLCRGVGGGVGLAGLQRLAHGLCPGDGARDLLGDLDAEAFELRDVDELDAGVRNRVQGRVQRVHRVDRGQGDAGVRLGLRLVLRVVVQRGPGARRDRAPAVLLGDQL